MARPKKNHILLTDADVKLLKAKIKSKNTNQIIHTRCQILLNLDENHSPVMTYDQCIAACCVSSNVCQEE